LLGLFALWVVVEVEFVYYDLVEIGVFFFVQGEVGEYFCGVGDDWCICVDGGVFGDYVDVR